MKRIIILNEKFEVVDNIFSKVVGLMFRNKITPLLFIFLTLGMHLKMETSL